MLRLYDMNTISEVKRIQGEQNGDLTIVRKGASLFTDDLEIEDALEDINKNRE
ncbi:YetF domain-containing protein [Enterococcus plantarum]|uniref:YetF domain-containing protein n=1 Tax=Enterococcus plantarum TaxID=1077675 RepID=UPI001C654460|nr:YetF domain-containing protein [Enterococcus plantarum]